jgi:glycosyltransferase involved in cell wall biosynthesis
MSHCDLLIADNDQNYAIAWEMGLAEEKRCPLGVIPGTGGITVSDLANRWTDLPSKRERLILWPKAFESPQSKALPVMEAIKLAWDSIQPSRVIMTAVIQEEIEMWFRTLPGTIQERCQVRDRIPRKELLDLMLKARVFLAPSLSDGVPNSLYEAMAGGAFPIVSPLETISSVVTTERNVLFARNLYPEEISKALQRAMNDDELVDKAARVNLELVKRIADREIIGPRVVSFYEELASS